MVYVLANLKVESYETWKTFFDKRSDTREGSGAKKLISSVTQMTRMKY